MSEEISPSNGNPQGRLIDGSVVLLREGAAGCEVLLRALMARGLSPVLVHDEPMAMVRLAELWRQEAQRRVLIVVEPDSWERLDELLSAVVLYHAGAYCWQFDSSEEARPQLSALDVSSCRLMDAAETGPIGRIRKRSRPVDQLLVSPSEQELSGREVVTQQELTMLLGPAPGIPGEAG